MRKACRVRRAAASERALARGGREWLEARCDVRDTVAFAAHARTFPAFRKLRRAALHAITQMAAQLRASPARAVSSTRGKLEPSSSNSSFGWSIEAFDEKLPWFDKWLPARFDSLYILPSIVVQQIRQGDERTSANFMAKCMAPRHEAQHGHEPHR